MLSCEEHPVAVNHVGFLYSLLLSFFRSLLISSGASFLQVRIFCDRKLLDLELNFSQRIPISNIIPDDGLQFTKFIHRTLKVDTTRPPLCWRMDLSTHCGWWLMLETFVAIQPHTSSSTAHLSKETTISFLKFRLCIINIIWAALPRPQQQARHIVWLRCVYTLIFNSLVAWMANQRHRTSLFVKNIKTPITILLWRCFWWLANLIA